MTVYHRIIIKNQQGMHARPALMLCELIQQFILNVLQDASTYPAEDTNSILNKLQDARQDRERGLLFVSSAG